jgi:hypothetical protein
LHPRSTSSLVSVVVAAAVLASPAVARAADALPAAPKPTEPAVAPNLAWLATQFIPSPEVAAGAGHAHFGLRWQVTPLLYSWGINRKLSPWRVLVAEPLSRQSGSIEAYLSPEFIDVDGDATDKWLLRPGVRAYFPVVQRGEYVSVSVGSSYQHLQNRGSAAFEGGVYVLYGLFGVQVTYAPLPHTPAGTIVTMRFRYF